MIFVSPKIFWSVGYCSMGCDNRNELSYGGPGDEWYVWVPYNEWLIWVPDIE